MQFGSRENQTRISDGWSRFPVLVQIIGDRIRLGKGFSSRYRRSSWQRPIVEASTFVFLIFRHMSSVVRLVRARQQTKLIILARPELLKLVYSPYLAASWHIPERVSRIVDHCETVSRIGGILSFPPNSVVDVLTLRLIDPQYRVTLDQARWFLREGQLVISLWHGVDRLYSLSFCLSSQRDGLKAYIGGIQGRAGADVLARYRLFTKQFYGMRPRDFLIEIFKLFCGAMKVTEIHAVSDSNRPTRPLEDEGAGGLNKIKTHYDKVWIERGGMPGTDGFFLLPLAPYRRALETIPAKKRAMYRKRQEMMDIVNLQLNQVLKVETHAIRSSSNYQVSALPRENPTNQNQRDN